MVVAQRVICYFAVPDFTLFAQYIVEGAVLAREDTGYRYNGMYTAVAKTETDIVNVKEAIRRRQLGTGVQNTPLIKLT